MKWILASTSPRRREILSEAGLAFDVETAEAEEIHDESMAPSALCEENARRKAAALGARAGYAVIGADTLVFLGNRVLGKPRNLEQAREMLRFLSGKTHVVCTGVCVLTEEIHVFHDQTMVTFRDLSEADIESYLSLVNPLDKAGSYGIQEHGERIVAGFEGSFLNVMGFPMERFLEKFPLAKSAT